jgi:hypothetical protein
MNYKIPSHYWGIGQGGFGGGCKSQTPVTLTTITTIFTPISVLTLSPDESLAFEIDIFAKRGVYRAFFKRVGQFYRVGSGNVISRQIFSSLVTDKTHTDFDIRTVLSGNDVTIEIKSAISLPMSWEGCLAVQRF